MGKSGAEDSFTDVQQMTDRVMIDLFKLKIKDLQRPLSHLQGTRSEAGDLLTAHFGKLSRIMNQNRSRLQDLYKAAIRELE